MVLLDEFLFLVVLVIPGFIIVSTGRYFSGVAEESPQFEYTRSILLWSFISNSVVIFSAGFLNQVSIANLDTLRQALFSFNSEITLLWLAIPLILGVMYAIGIILRIPSRFRGSLQKRIYKVLSIEDHVIRTTDPAWRSFLSVHEYVALATSGVDENGNQTEKVYSGQVLGFDVLKDNKYMRLYKPYTHIQGEKLPVFPNSENNTLAHKDSELLIPEKNILRIAAVPSEYYPNESSTRDQTQTGTDEQEEPSE